MAMRPGIPPLPPPGGCGDDRFRRDFNSGHAFWSSEGDTVIRLAQTNWSLVVIFIISLILLQKGKKNPIFVMVLAGVMKVAVALVENLAACCGTIF